MRPEQLLLEQRVLNDFTEESSMWLRATTPRVAAPFYLFRLQRKCGSDERSHSEEHASGVWVCCNGGCELLEDVAGVLQCSVIDVPDAVT